MSGMQGDCSSSEASNLRPLTDLLRPSKQRLSKSQLPSTGSKWAASPTSDESFPQGREGWSWRQLKKSFRPTVVSISASATLLNVRSLVIKAFVALVAIPGMLMLIGGIVEKTVYGDTHNTTNFHHRTMVFSGLIAGPFILLRWCWKWPKHLAKLEMCFHIIHTTIFLVTVFMTMIDGSTAYFIAEKIRHGYADSKYTSIATPDDVYTYLQHVMQRVYTDEKDDNISDTRLLHRLPGKLSLSGPIRLKQSRTKRKACSDVLENLGADIEALKCYPQYSADNEEKEPYGEGLEFTYIDLKFKNYAGVEIKDSEVYMDGRFGGYPISGYWVLFDKWLEQREALDLVDSIKNASWIDDQTSQISLDFTVVAKDLSRPIITTVLLMIEVSPAGMFLPMAPTVKFTYVEYLNIFFNVANNICPAVNTQSRFLRPMYIGVLPIVIYTIFSLIYQLYSSRQDFFRSTYTYVEGVWIGVVVSVLIFRWRSIYFTHCDLVLQSQSMWPGDEVRLVGIYETLPMAANWHRARQMLCIALFLYIFNSLKFVTKIMLFDTVGRTLTHAFANLASFAVSFSIVFLGFGVMFYFLFSAEDENYRSFPRTVSTVWNALLGDININSDLIVSREAYLPLLIIFTFFLSFILLTVIIAIVTDAFEKARHEHCSLRRRRNSGWQSLMTVNRQSWVSRAAVGLHALEEQQETELGKGPL